MVGTLCFGLPLVARPQDAPTIRIMGLDLLGGEFAGDEITAQAAIVIDADRLLDVLDPLGFDLLDQRPGSHRLHIDALVLVIDRLGHLRLPIAQGL